VNSRLARLKWRAILEYAVARAEQSIGWLVVKQVSREKLSHSRANRSRRAQTKPRRTAWGSLSGTSALTVDKTWTQLLSDYSAAQESFDASSDVLHAHLALNTLPTPNEFLAEERARAKIIVAQARLCADWPKN